MSEILKIQEFTIEDLRNTGNSAFLERISNATSLLTNETDQTVVAEFKTAFNAFNDVVKLKQSFVNTEDLILCDQLADSAWRGLHGQTKVMLRHPSEEVCIIANKAMQIIDKYGDITNLSYNDEYGAMDNLIVDLNALGDKTLRKIYLADWLTELTLRRREFMAKQAVREDEKAQIEVGETKAKRLEADRAYRDFVEMINARARVFGTANYEAFIKRANVIIDEAKIELAQRAAKNNNADSPTE